MPNESLIRLASFLGVFGLMAIWEVAAPRRSLSTPKPKRWFANLGMVLLDTLIVRVLFPTAAIGTAFVANRNGWGVLNHLAWPEGLAILLAVVTLDLILYLQHLIFHSAPLLWRFHMVHHADLDSDVTTGVRFHPVEIIISMLIKLIAVISLGAPPLAVLIFEVMLNATSMFNHSNVRMPKELDRFLRRFVVTPDMHRVHHSVIRRETNSNFGFNLPWWDRLFRTYRPEPEKGQETMTLGLFPFQNPDRLTLPWILALPFIEKARDYPLYQGKTDKS